MPSESPTIIAGAKVRKRQNRIGLLAMVLIGIGFSVAPLVSSITEPTSNKDYSRWWNAAMDVRNAAPLQVEPGEQSFIYPPASAVIFYTPLSFLGETGMVAALCVLNCAAHIGAVLLSVRMATGRSLNQHPLLYAIPVAVTVPFVWDTYYLGQPNLVLLAAMLLGLWRLDRPGLAASWWSGSIFAAAMVAKAFPATVLGFLVWRRHWMSAVAMTLCALTLLLVVPGPIRGFEANARETGVWLDRMIFSTSGDSLAGQPGRAFRSGNQSMLSVIHRLTRDIEASPDEDVSIRVNIVSLGSHEAFTIFAAVAAAICLAFVLAMPRRDRRNRRSNGLEYAILLILMTIFSPKAGTYYSCWMIPGLTMVTAEILRAPVRSNRRLLLSLGLALCVLVMLTALLQLWGINTPQALGATFWGEIILLMLLLACLYMTKRSGDSATGDNEELGDLAIYLSPGSAP